jgi:cytochrome c oxidase assembly protein subunit 15
MRLDGISTGRLRPTPWAFVRIALVSLAGLMVIIPSGALVRLTGSGLGCPDWPGCHGQVVPPLSGHAWIEYSNRIVSGLVVIVAILTWVAALRMPGAPRRLRRWAAVPAIAGFLQGPLGALTVLSGLNPLLVSSHFLLSMAALGGGAMLALAARDHAMARTRGLDRGRARLAAGAAVALAGVLVTGVLVTAAGPYSGDPKVIRRLGNLADAAAIHVRVVIAFCVLALALGIWLVRRRPGDPLTLRLGALFLPLLALQIALGEYQYRHRLPRGVVLTHVTVAGSVWTCGVAVAWLAARPWTTAPDTTGQPADAPASSARALADARAASQASIT